MTLTVRNDPQNARYVLLDDGEQIGMAEYELDDDTIDFIHTEVDRARREKGMASRLVHDALDDVRENSERRVVASCPYVTRWLTQHPEYRDLLDR